MTPPELPPESEFESVAEFPAGLSLPAPRTTAPPDHWTRGAREAKATYARVVAEHGYDLDPDAMLEIIGRFDELARLWGQVRFPSELMPLGPTRDNYVIGSEINATLRSFNVQNAASRDHLLGYAQAMRDIREAYLRRDYVALDRICAEAGES